MIISRHQTGKIRSLRNIAFSILFTIYFLLPWMRWNGYSMIRLDIPERKFYLLGNVFIPMEGYFLWLFLVGTGLSLFFFTALIGRVWCGWACPQTLFTDVFDWIGRKVMGSKYGKKDAPPARKVLLHMSWILFSLIASLTWVAYFSDPYIMIQDVITGAIFSWDAIWPFSVLFFTLTLYGDMAFIREQFCRYACPYARFQTVLMDADSYNVTYDVKRGEPRRKGKERIGDCIACNMCLVVCPTGIDIRDGVNVGCIACAKCVDACTVIMGKEDKVSLIRYMSHSQMEDPNSKIKWVRPRTVIYALLLVAVLVASTYLLSTRVPLYVSVLPDRHIQPIQLPGNKVRNFYNVKLQNISLQDQEIQIELDGKDFSQAPMLLGGDSNNPTVTIPKNSMTDIRVIVETGELNEADIQKRNHLISVRFVEKNNPSIMKEKLVPFSLPNDMMGLRE